MIRLRTSSRRRSRWACLALGLLVAAAACGGERAPAQGGAGTMRLVELFDDARVADSPIEAAAIERTEWRFDLPTASWHAASGVEGLRVEDGRLKGRTTQSIPVIWGEREPRGEPGDTVHALEVRMRATRGSNLYFSFHGGGPPDAERARSYWASAPEHLQVPILGDGTLRTYSVEPRGSVWMANVSSLVLSPCDETGADFEIESVRLVSRNEHLASLSAGVGWHEARGVWRESILARVPEVITFPLRLPERAWLDLSVAVVHGEPVVFRVSVTVDGARQVIGETNVTERERWIELPVDIAAWGGKDVELGLELDAPHGGAICLWGSPVVRERVPVEAETVPQGVIVILADALRPDHLSFAGYERETTLALTTIAKRGAHFTDCTAQATWTQPSMASIVTSLHPASHGVVGMGDTLSDDAETLAEVFRDSGFATIGYSSVKFTGRFTRFHQGFEVLHETESLPEEKRSKSASYYVARLVPWLEQHRDDRFFVFLHLFDPHDPYEPRSPFDTHWADAARTETHKAEADRAREHIADPALREIGLPTRAELDAAGIDADRWIAHERDWYDGSILGMDQEIARLMESIKALGLLKKVLVVFTSDHGEEFFEHGRTWHGQSVYGELTRVPLVFYGGGVPRPGLVIDEPVRSIDIMPTLLHLFDLRAPAHLQGQSLVPLLRAAAGMESPGDDWVRRPIVSQKVATEDERMSPPPRKVGKTAISDGRWKLVHNEPRAEGEPEFELYDRQIDPLDRHDLASEHPEIVAELRQLLDEWKKEVGRVRLDAEGSGEIDAEALRDIRAMGYAK